MNRAGKDSGFTLLEIMIALAILAGVVTAVLGTLNYHLDVASQSRKTLTATLLGKELSEEVAVMGLPRDRAGVFAEHPEYSWSIRGVEDEEIGMLGYEKVEVTVTWNQSEVSFVSYLPER